MARILIVDDELNFSRMLQHILQHEGYETIVVHDGTSALDAARQNAPDIVLLDVMIPPPDGFETLRQLKADPRTVDVRVIMLTLKDDDASIAEGWTSGADGYLIKEPFEREHLLMFIQRILADKEEDKFRVSAATA